MLLHAARPSSCGQCWVLQQNVLDRKRHGANRKDVVLIAHIQQQTLTTLTSQAQPASLCAALLKAVHKLTCAAPADFITSRCLLDRDLNLCSEAMLAPWSVPAFGVILPGIALILEINHEQLHTWRSLLYRLCTILCFMVRVIQSIICLALGCHFAFQRM